MKNHFYVVPSRGEQETSLGVVTDMLKVLSVDVYVLLDLGATLLFFTPLVTKLFYIFPDIFDEPFIVSTAVGSRLLQKGCIKIVL